MKKKSTILLSCGAAALTALVLAGSMGEGLSNAMGKILAEAGTGDAYSAYHTLTFTADDFASGTGSVVKNGNTFTYDTTYLTVSGSTINIAAGGIFFTNAISQTDVTDPGTASGYSFVGLDFAGWTIDFSAGDTATFSLGAAVTAHSETRKTKTWADMVHNRGSGDGFGTSVTSITNGAHQWEHRADETRVDYWLDTVKLDLQTSVPMSMTSLSVTYLCAAAGYHNTAVALTTPSPLTTVSTALEIGGTQKITEAWNYADGTEVYTWSTSNAAICTVSASGLVTAVGNGEAVITLVATLGTTSTQQIQQTRTWTFDVGMVGITASSGAEYTITASDGTSALPSTIAKGSSLAFKVTPTTGYEYYYFSIKNNGTEIATASGDVSIADVEAAVNITVTVTSIQDKINSGFGGLWNYVRSGSEATLSSGTYTYPSGQSLTTQTAFVQDALNQGFTHVKFAMSCVGADHFLLTSGGTGFNWNTYWKQLSGDSVEFYVDLNTLYSSPNYGTLTILPRDSSAAAYTASPMTLGGITFYKSATSSWTKSGTSGYACLEDASTLIVDTASVGNDARVYAPYSWVSQFATSGFNIKFKFLVKGSNTRGPILGKRTGTTNTDYAAGDLTTADSEGYYSMSMSASTMAGFTSSDSLEIGLDHEGVVQIIIQ